MTALASPAPATADIVRPRRPVPPPLSNVHVDLLPDEVRNRRRLRYLKRRLAFALGALVLLLGLGDALVRQQTSSAQDDLNAANARVAMLNQQIGGFAAIVGAQSEVTQIRSALSQAMSQDVPWSSLVSRLQTLAPRGLRITAVNGSVGGSSGAATGTAPASGAGVVGSLTVSGTTRDYRSVADYVVSLAKVKGFTAVTPSTTGSGATTGSLAFTIDIALTSDGQGGRYAATPSSSPSSPAPATSTPSSSPAVAAPGGPAPTSPSAAVPEGN